MMHRHDDWRAAYLRGDRGSDAAGAARFIADGRADRVRSSGTVRYVATSRVAASPITQARRPGRGAPRGPFSVLPAECGADSRRVRLVGEVPPLLRSVRSRMARDERPRPLMVVRGSDAPVGRIVPHLVVHDA